VIWKFPIRAGIRSKRLNRRFSAPLALVALAAAGATPAAAPPPSEGRSGVLTFDQYTPLASNLVMAGRLLTPLTAEQLRNRLATTGQELRDQPIDLAHEQFRVYVPERKPPAGYGVFVFVPPWQENDMPRGWETAFDAGGVIFVSAARSGNQESPLGRREPLAILAAYNVIQRFPVDRSRVYIGGFSGGSRIALRLALGYPDLFRGAFLDAGSDPIGEADLPLPPRPLFEQFRTSSRLIYVTGTHDDYHMTQQSGSVGSMSRFCVANVSTQPVAGLGHALAPPSVVAGALRMLSTPAPAPTSRAEQCWTRLTAEVDEELSQAEAKMDRGDSKGARHLLDRIDKRFSGLAAPRSVALARKLKGSVSPGARESFR
jgi:predicted esterase